MVQLCQPIFIEESLKDYIFIIYDCSTITCITINSIYR